MSFLKRIKKYRWVILLICVILFVIPFFWIKPTELALGGDSSRLYLFDPQSFLRADSLYIVEPNGLGALRSDQSTIPFVLLLEGIYFISHSPFILTCLLYSVSLVGAFLSTYLILTEILTVHDKKNNSFSRESAAILGGIFYALSPSVGWPMQFALIIHNQIFLNPTLFYLAFRFLLTQKWKYLWFFLLTTLLFSPNFTLAVPAVFSFYPLAFIFLGVYVRVYRRQTLPWKKIGIGALLFLGLQSFHLLPVIASIFDTGSAYNTRLFNSTVVKNEGIRYFNSILDYGMSIKSFFYSYQQFQWTTFLAPLTIMFGFLLVKRKQKDFFLIAIFFFITTFLESANITNIGVIFYRFLFYIPGFSMFRNFFGQWQWVQDFFYTLLVGYSLFLLFSKLKKRIISIIVIGFVLLMICMALPFLSGQIIRPALVTTKNVSTVMVMDPNFKKALFFIRNLPIDGKIIDFPFTENAYQVIPGLNQGAYVGPSPTSFLTGKRDFSGRDILSPFQDVFLTLIQQKDYMSIKRLFGLLNIRYIFYISDPKAYNAFFPSLPYTLLLTILPDSQSLSDFVSNIKDKTVFQEGYYSLYNSDENYYLPHFYIPKKLTFYDNNGGLENASFFLSEAANDPRVGYIDKNTCNGIHASLCSMKSFDDIPTIRFKKINLTKYRVEISHVTGPFFLIFSDKFHKDWKAFLPSKQLTGPTIKSYFNGQIQEQKHEDIFFDTKTFETLGVKSVDENHHFMINGYANAWYITPQDVEGKQSYEIIVEMIQQRLVYYGLAISIVSAVILLLFGAKILWRK